MQINEGLKCTELRNCKLIYKVFIETAFNDFRKCPFLRWDRKEGRESLHQTAFVNSVLDDQLKLH